MFAISDLKKTKVYAEAYQEGQQEALTRERPLVVRLLKCKVGELPKATLAYVDRLSLMQLEDLAEALLDFGELVDLDNWLGQLTEKRAELTEMLTQGLGTVE